MLIKEDKISDYTETFIKKFDNFAERTPVKVAKALTDSFCIIDVHSRNLSKQFDFDFNKEVTELIHEIRNWLFTEAYPRMIKRDIKEVPLNYKELTELIESGVDPDKAVLTKKSEVAESHYVIEKVLLKKDRLVVRDKTNNRLDLYELKMPVSFFLRKANNEWNETETYEKFKTVSTLLKQDLKDSLGDADND